MRRVTRAMMKVSEKIWGGRTPDEVLSKRYKLFVLLGALLTGLFSVYRTWVGITFLPNFEWVIPTLVVVGSFSLPLGGSKFWGALNRYFGVIALVSVCTFDLLFFGLLPTFPFKWSGLAFAWFLALRNKLSMSGYFRELLGPCLLTTAIAIILFDIWTGIIGFPLTWGVPVWAAFIGQIPFTFYHLCSLLFVPPLVGLGKLLVKVKVPVPVAIQAGAKVASIERR